MHTQLSRPVRRRRGPTIAWAPTHDPYHIVAGILSSAALIPPLHITQAAILGVEAAIKETTTTLPFGLLAGQFCVCPDTNVEYLLIDEVTAARTELTPFDLPRQLATELRALSSDATRRRKLPIGWYVGDVGEDLQLGNEDLTVHREVFPEAWHVVLVHDASFGMEQAAFVRFEGMTNRSYAAPFFELLPEPGRGRNKTVERRTVLPWANYRPDEPVIPLAGTAPFQVKAAGGTPASEPSRAKTWFGFLRRAESGGDRFEVRPQRDDVAPAQPALEQRAYVAPLVESPVAPVEPPSRPDSDLASQATLHSTSHTTLHPAATDARMVQSASMRVSPAQRKDSPGRFVFIHGELVTFSDEPADEPPSAAERGRALALAVAALLTLGAVLGSYLIYR